MRWLGRLHVGRGGCRCLFHRRNVTCEEIAALTMFSSEIKLTYKYTHSMRFLPVSHQEGTLSCVSPRTVVFERKCSSVPSRRTHEYRARLPSGPRIQVASRVREARGGGKDV